MTLDGEGASVVPHPVQPVVCPVAAFELEAAGLSPLSPFTACSRFHTAPTAPAFANQRRSIASVLASRVQRFVGPHLCTGMKTCFTVISRLKRFDRAKEADDPLQLSVGSKRAEINAFHHCLAVSANKLPCEPEHSMMKVCTA